MLTNCNKCASLLMVALVFAVGMIFALTGGNALAQGPDPSELEARLTSLENTVERLFNLMIVIPILSGLVIVVLEISTAFTQRAERKFVREREEREAKRGKDLLDRVMEIAWQRESRESDTAAKFHDVMSSVNELLRFESDQAKQITTQLETIEKLIEQFDATQGVEAILNRVDEVRLKVKRSNLHDYHTDITELAHRMTDMENFFGLPDFKQSIPCHYIRALAAHLENRIEAANSHFDAVSQLGKTPPDEYIEPLSLYFRGVLLKNLTLYDEARQCLESALDKWPTGKREIRTQIELAEVVALQKHYSISDKRTKPVFAVISELADAVDNGSEELTSSQKANLKAQQERLWLIEGNYAFKSEEWENAIEHYTRGLKVNPNGIFSILSIGISRLKMNQDDEAMATLEKAYNRIIAGGEYVTHPEPRGRILLGASAIITARLVGLRDPVELQLTVLREIETLRRINARSPRNFHIFSPLTKQMHTLEDFREHFSHPLDILRQGDNR
jgi:tetratricopeptide (TPR) repeat protein